MKEREKIRNLLSILKKDLAIVKKELRDLPKERLMISVEKGIPQFYEVSGDSAHRRRRRITGNEYLIYRLAHKMYLELYVMLLEAYINELSESDHDCESFNALYIIRKLPKNFEILDQKKIINPNLVAERRSYPNPVGDGSVSPVEFSLSIGELTPLEWAAKPYCENTAELKHKRHRTTKGFLCRSKGEAGVLNIYDRLGIPYHYDELLYINGQLVSPDIIGVRRDGVLVFHEHRGWKGASYYRRNYVKDGIYLNAGIIQGINYIVTYEDEDGNINYELCEAIIRNAYGL